MNAPFDVVVVGAGPGGIAAAAVAAEAGKRVCLLDNNSSPGGQIWRGFSSETAGKYPHGRTFLDWMARLQASGCEVQSGWQVVDAPGPGRLRLECGSESRDLGFERLILATGARERFLPFPGWTLPGVMGAGGLQALVKGGLDPRGKRVAVSGSGPLLLAVAAGLASAGAIVTGIFEQASMAQVAGFGMYTLLTQPGKIAEGAGYRLKMLSAPYRLGWWVTRTEGRGRVERVTVTDGRTARALDCDWLACGFGLVPNLELPRLLGCRIVDGAVEVDNLQQSSTADVACVGELTGIGGLEKALAEGEIAGWVAADLESEARGAQRRLRPLRSFGRRMERAFAPRRELAALPAHDTVVCRCEDVVHEALQGCTSAREAKLHTRCGMGACQGRICGTAAEFLYGWQQPSVRPPILPARIATLAAEADTKTRVKEPIAK
jgi:NADPH-dependent 2,4-dienoyl-CoA reductase/sulfur reductase-like enzyme